MFLCPQNNVRFRCRRGQALVEFALVLPFLIILVLGIMEFGWLTKNQLTVANAVREGARTAALGKSTSEITTTIENQTQSVAGSPDNLTVTLKRDDNDASNGYSYEITLGDTTDDEGNTVNDAPAGAMIQVTASIPNQPLTGFFPFLRNRVITVSVVMRREA